MVTISSVKWRKPSVEELAKMEDISVYEAKKLDMLFRKGSVLSKVKSPKREMKKISILKKITESFPCTFSVLKRKTNLSSPTLSRYLKTLCQLKVLKKEFDPKTELDIYYLDRMLRMVGDPFYGVGGVLDAWYSTSEYSISKVFRKNSKIRLSVAGKKVRIKS